MNMFSHRQRSGDVDLSEQMPLRLLRHRLRRIDELLATLPAARPDDHSYQGQETRSLRNELLGLKRSTENQIAEAVRPPDLERRAKHERLLDGLEADRRARKLEFIERLREQRDFRQANVHLLDLVRVRETLAIENGLKED